MKRLHKIRMFIIDMASKVIDYVVAAVVVSLLLVITLTTLLIDLSHSTTSSNITLPANPIVTTPWGHYEGIIQNISSDSFVARYAGIPFAQPPLGELRFREPQPLFKTLSNRTIDAKDMRLSCWSMTKTFPSRYYGEDCLYLNVYVPVHQEAARKAPFAVMVWIHGGGFVAGSVFPEPWLFVARGQVIVVAVNYRLGPFGFLTTQSNDLPANNGLRDQVLAMEWVKENIQYFGGDADSITIFGESAGAISSALHSISPVSTHYFHKAIFQSGSATSLLSRDSTSIAVEFGGKVGCSMRFDTAEFASCLRNASVPTILEHAFSISMTPAQKQVDFVWMPIVDGTLIPDDPVSLINNKSYLTSIGAFNRDYMFGINNDEGSLLIHNFLSPINATIVENKWFLQDLAEFLVFMRYGLTREQVRNVTSNVMTFYTGEPIPEHPSKEAASDLFADAVFIGPGISMAKSLSRCNTKSTCSLSDSTSSPQDANCFNKTGKTYLYYFDFCLPKLSPDCEQMCMQHGNDVPFEFPKQIYPDIRQQVSDIFIDVLTCFAKTSDPGCELSFQFPDFESKFQYYLNLSPFPSVRQHLRPSHENLWTRTIPDLLKP